MIRNWFVQFWLKIRNCTKTLIRFLSRTFEKSLVVFLLLLLLLECAQLGYEYIDVAQVIGWLPELDAWWLPVVTAALALLGIYVVIGLRPRLRRLEREVMVIPLARYSYPHDDNATAPNVPVLNEDGATAHNQNGRDSRQHTTVSQTTSDPRELFQRMIEYTTKQPGTPVQPEFASKPWLTGFATHQGHVRSENQDHGLCFRLGQNQILVVADGCGGVPHGRKAAHCAVLAAAAAIWRSFATGGDRFPLAVEKIAESALLHASQRLAAEGKKLRISDPLGGLRTTLIIVIAEESAFGYAYIGDGGGCVVRTSGEVEHFLVPQKASSDAMNVLAASLGPEMQGEPVCGRINRQPGDLLIVGTDGVFDRVDETFAKDLLRATIQHDGDFENVAKLFLQELADYQDDAGFVFDDNLSLGLIGDGAAPALARGFWSTPTSSPPAETRQSLNGRTS